MCQNILDPYTFDADFERMMNENIEKLEEVREKQWRRRAFYVGDQICRRLMVNLARFCQIDLYGSREMASPAIGDRLNESIEPEAEARKLPKRKGFRWERIVQFVYIYCSIRCSVYIFFQYVHDMNYVRLKRIQQAMASHGDSETATINTTLSEIYFERVQEAARWLHFIGAPYFELTFGIEVFSVFFLIMSFGLYLNGQVYFARHHRFDFSIVRGFLDLPKELRLCNGVIRTEMNRFVESSRIFTRTSLLLLQKHLFGGHTKSLSHYNYLFDLRFEGDLRPLNRSQTSFVRRRVPLLHSKSRDSVDGQHEQLARDRVLDHFYTIKQIESLALNGSLMPCTRSNDWIKRVSHTSSIFCMVFILYCSCVQVVVLFTLPRMANITLHASFMDLLTLAESFLMTLIVIISSIFYGSLILTMSLDQVHLVSQLKRNIGHTIAINTLRHRATLSLIERIRQLLAALGASDKLKNETMRDLNQRRYELMQELALRVATSRTQMNARLLNVFLQYKIFVAQLIPAQRSCGFVSLAAITLMVLMPLIGCIHVPYTDMSIKFYVGMLSLLCTFVADAAILVPISYLHANTVGLYRHLSSLLAHTVAVSVEQTRAEFNDANLDNDSLDSIIKLLGLTNFRLENFKPVYNEHAVWLLRKELNQPDCQIDQFVTHVCGVRINYNNLLRVHFWVGLMIRTIFYESTSFGSQPEFFTSILMDPLGLFNNQ